MATYRLAPNLGKPPPLHALTKRGRRASKQGAAAMRRAASGRKWGSTAERNLAARRAAALAEVRGGPHPLPVERIGVDELTGSAKSLAHYADDLGLVVLAATNGRDVEVRIGRQADPDGGGRPGMVGRAVFREGRLVHTFVLRDGMARKVTLTALRAALASRR